MVSYTRPELEITEFEIIDVLTATTSYPGGGDDIVYGGADTAGDWY